MEALGCICCALLALGQESCYGPRERLSAERKRDSKLTSLPRTSVDSCRATGASTGEFSAKAQPSSKKRRRNASLKANGDVCFKGCCAESKAPGIADRCPDACCAEEKPTGPTEKPKEISTYVAHATDSEEGLSGKEHVILSVSSMTCTGCETKLKRTLATVESVKNLKASLVLARAEFDLDLGAASLVEVMKHLERTTEFKCVRINEPRIYRRCHRARQFNRLCQPTVARWSNRNEYC